MFSPSQPSWLNYTDEQFISAYTNAHRAELGTEIHEWSSSQIKLSNKVSSLKEIEKGVKTHIFEKWVKAPEYRDILLKNIDYLPDEVYPTVKMFINDCIGYRMESEKKVSYSNLFWGTSDAIKFEKNKLMVFDLKTGSKPAKESQVFVYAALYFLENHLKPDKVDIETRLYQNAEIRTTVPDPGDISAIMQKIVHLDSLATKFDGGKRR